MSGALHGDATQIGTESPYPTHPIFISRAFISPMYATPLVFTGIGWHAAGITRTIMSITVRDEPESTTIATCLNPGAAPFVVTVTMPLSECTVTPAACVYMSGAKWRSIAVASLYLSGAAMSSSPGKLLD
eukprot:3134958-Rhodomonas_salina.2